MSGSGPTKPIPEGAKQLVQFVQENIGDQFRSAVWYDRGDFEILHIQDDVRSQYSETEVKDVVDELTMESLAKPIKEDVYAHGDLRCTVECYEGGIELHFILDKGEGVAIGLDPAAFIRHDTFIGSCIEEVEFSG